jgi:single-strand DNA-binding protein
MSVNKFICIGNIGKKPEFRVAVSGSSIANFSVAVTERFRDKEGAQKENTEWINVVAFNRLAEIVDHYMDKGTQVYVEGKLRTEKYEKDGQTKYITKIVAEKIQMLSDKKSTQKENDNAVQNKPAEQLQEFDDDIPF